MNARTRALIRSAERKVGRLVEECRKGVPLYAEAPKATAQVSRTAKWLLNALAGLTQAASAATSSDGHK